MIQKIKNVYLMIRLYYLRYLLLGVKMDEVHVLVVACMERAVLEMTGMKMNAGITIFQDQWVYSNRTFAEAVNVGVQKVKKFIKRMVDAGRIQVDVVTVQSSGFNKRQLLTWLY